MDLSGFERNFLAEVHSNKSIFNLLGDDQVQLVSSHFEQSVDDIETGVRVEIKQGSKVPFWVINVWNDSCMS